MFGISPTAYDLRFQLFGIPVRVHPMFWLATAILASSNMLLPEMLLWIVCVFVSILVHEFGHGLLAKRYSNCREILLYSFGGLCFYSPEPRRESQQLGIVLAGPGAGFLLCAAFMIATSLIWGITPNEHIGYASRVIGFKSDWSGEAIRSMIPKFPGPRSYDVYHNMVFINLMWGLVNLLPILPLDGGHVAQILLKQFNRAQGQRWTYIVSLLAAGLIAVYGMTRPQPNLFLILMFGSLAVMNYQSLHAIHLAQTSGLTRNDDWWRP